jgi:hypothetical protein
VYERVRQGGSDDEVAEWCFQRGLRPTKMQIRLWNEFSCKFGWNDVAAKFVERVILDRTAERVGKEMTHQPAVEAELRSLIGRLYFEIGIL